MLFAYLLIVEKQYKDVNKAGNYNIGPDNKMILKTEDLVETFCKVWGEEVDYLIKNDKGPHESNYLILNSDKIRKNLNWKSQYEINKAIQK